MKKIKTIMIILVLAVLLSGCASAKVENGEKMEIKDTYSLVINGYDWGPAVDKIVVNTGAEVSKKKLKAQDFSVAITTQAFSWTSFPPEMKTVTGERKITSIYLCDAQGNPTGDSAGNHIAMEMEVHPEDPFCNPFIYSSDMMNHWQGIYKAYIKNEKLKLAVDEEEARICPLADQFKMGTSKTGKITLSYGAYEPVHNGKTPLVVWLHGMGEGGRDPRIALLGNKVVNLITPDVQNCFGENGAYVLAPQANGFWMQTKYGVTGFETWIGENNPVIRSCYTEALFNLIDEYVKANPDIDNNRIYIGGCSNGGYMTMNMIIEYPDYFAAAYPVCQAYPNSKIDEEKLELLAKQHIWFTQSKDDTTVNPNSCTVPTFERLKEIGAQDVHFTLWDHVDDQTGNFKKDGKPYRYNGHFSWIYTLNNECEENGESIFVWMSKQRK